MLLDECTLKPYGEELLHQCEPFDCGDADLNDFFENDSLHYSRNLMGKSYCFTLDADPRIIVCAFTVSNDSIKVSDLPNARKKKVNRQIPREKQFRSYPSVLIGRLGVHSAFRGKGVGHELMDFIKSWFVDAGNKTGCRFIVVDAYNNKGALGYYEREGFGFLFSSEDQEKEYLNYPPDHQLHTRLMYFDLIVLTS